MCSTSWCRAVGAKKPRRSFSASNDLNPSMGRVTPFYCPMILFDDGVLLQEWLVICYNESDSLDPKSLETGHA